MSAEHMARRKQLREQRKNNAQSLRETRPGRPQEFVGETAAVTRRRKALWEQRRNSGKTFPENHGRGRPTGFAAETVLDALIERADLIGRGLTSSRAATMYRRCESFARI